MDQDFSFFHYLKILTTARKSILIVVSASIFLTVCVTLLRPAKYISTVTLLLAEEGSSVGSSLGNILGISGFSGGSASQDTLITILQSRRMANDIRERFKSDANPLWWKLDPYIFRAGLGINVITMTPVLSEKIANFCIENLDKINSELQITAKRPMVKVLDPATRGEAVKKDIPKKVIIMGMFSFLASSFWFLALDYFKKRKL